MTLTQLLFSFKGRINRKPWWLASLGAGFAASLLTAILEAVARSAGETIVNPVTHQFEPTGIFGLAISLIALVNAWSPSRSALSGCMIATAPAGGSVADPDHRRRRDPHHGRHHGA